MFSPLPIALKRAAAILALPAALILRRFFGAASTLAPFTFAQRAFCTAAIRARPAADIPRRPRGLAAAATSPPAMAASSVSNSSIFSLIEMAWRNCATVRFCRDLIYPGRVLPQRV
jgi:hypothetical protein